jgi:hypothetical protein
MDARTSQPDTAAESGELKVGTKLKLSAYGRARRRQERIRKMIRGPSA